MNKLFAALGLGVLMWAIPAGAQTAATMRFEIPFNFVAGDHALPAGAYRVTVSQDFNLARLESVSDPSVHVVRLVPGRTERAFEKAGTGSVRFAKYGDRYFLTGVWKSGSVSGNDTIPSKRQVESARAAGVAGEVVSVSSDLR